MGAPRPRRNLRAVLALQFVNILVIFAIIYYEHRAAKKFDVPAETTVSTFHCPSVPRNYSLPFQWFCHPAAKGVTLEGPHGKVALEHLGRIHDNGPHLYSFRNDLNGSATVLWNKTKVVEFVARPELCKCPKPLRDFAKEYTCSEKDKERVDRIFTRWMPKTVTREILKEVAHYTAKQTFGHYAIIENEIYFRQLGLPDARAFRKINNILQSITRKVRLPNVEFYFHNRDLPLVNLVEPTPHIFAFCSSPLHSEIMIPGNDILREAFTGFALKLACKGRPWRTRIPKAYFRGANTGAHVEIPDHVPFHNRFRAAMIASKRRDLFDVKVQPRHKVRIGDSALEWVSSQNLTLLESDAKTKSMAFKYALDLDGNSAPYRTSALLVSGSVLVKQNSPYAEYFYEELEPGVHYLPVDNGLNSLVEVVEWARDHDDEAEKIAAQAAEFYSTRLRQEDLLCWMAYCLHKVKVGLAFEPTIDTLPKDMVKLESKAIADCVC